MRCLASLFWSFGPFVSTHVTHHSPSNISGEAESWLWDAEQNLRKPYTRIELTPWEEHGGTLVTFRMIPVIDGVITL